MKIVTLDGATYELHKRELSIKRVKRLPDGSKEYVDSVTYTEPSVCNFEWGQIEGETIKIENMWAIISRGEARDLRINKYYTGSPCKRDHISQRYTTTGLCVACISERAKRFSKAVRDTPPDTVSLKDRYVHPDDVKAVDMLIASLKQARDLAERPTPS